MPYDFSDEKLDKLAAAPREARLKWIGALSDEDRGALVEATKRWKANRKLAQGPEVQEPSPDYMQEFVAARRPDSPVGVNVTRATAQAEGMQVEDDPGLTPPGVEVTTPLPPSMRKPSVSAAPKESGYDFARGMMPSPMLPLPGGQMMQDAVKAGIGQVQEHVGRPVSEALLGIAGFDPQAPLPGNLTLSGSSDEPLARASLGLVGGERMEKAGSAEGERRLRGELGDTGAEVAKGVARTLPLTPIGLPAAEGVAVGFAAKFPTLATIIRLAGEGAMGGYAEGILVESQNPAESAAAGAGGAAVLGGAVAGAGKVLGGARKVIGKIKTPEVFRQIADEVQGLLLRSDPLEELGIRGAEVGQSFDNNGARDFANAAEGISLKPAPKPGAAEPMARIVEKPTDPGFKPNAAFAVETEDGQIAIRLTQMEPGQVPAIHDIPLKSTADFEKAGRLMQKHGAPYMGASASAEQIMENTPDSAMKFLTEVVANPETTKAGRATPRITAATPEPVKRPPTSEEFLTRAIRETDPFQAPDLDAGPISHAPREVEVVAGETLHFETPPPPDATVPSESLRATGGGALTPPPPPPPAVPPGEGFSSLPPSNRDGYDEMARVIQKVARSRDPGLLKQIAEGALADHLRGPDELRHWILRAKSSAALYQNRSEVLRALRQEMPGKNVFDKAAVKLGDVALGKKVDGVRYTLDDFAREHPEVGAHLSRLSKDLFAEMDRLQRNISKYGGIDPNLVKLRDEGAIDQYVAQMYRAYYLGKGKWAEIAPIDTIREGVEFLVKEAKSKGIKWTEAQIERGVLDAMNAARSPADLKGTQLGKAFNHLLNRKDIPAPIKKLLGYEDSGPVRVAFTVAAQRAIENNLSVWHEIVQNGKYWSKTPVVDEAGDWIQVPLNKRYFGRAAGGFVHPDLAPILESGKDTTPYALSLWRALGANFKANVLTFGGAVPYVNQFIRGWKGAYFSGGLDILRPRESGASMLEALKVMADWHGVSIRVAPFSEARLTLKKAMPVDPHGNSLLMEARRAGAMPPGLGHTETTPAQQRALFEKLGRQLEKDGGKSDMFSLIAAGRKVADEYRTRKAEAAFVYDTLEQWWKMASYISLRKKHLRIAARNGLEGQPAVEWASRQSAALINRFFPNFEHVGHVVDKIRKHPLGAVAPFFTGAFEDLRVDSMIVKDTLTDKRVLGKSVGFGLMMASFFGLSNELRKLNGISDADVDELYKTRAEKDKEFFPDWAIWTTPFRDSLGKPIQYNLAQPFPVLQFIQGPAEDPMWKKIIFNLATAPMPEQAKQMMREGLAKAGAVSPMRPRGMPTIEGNTGARQVLDFMGNNGLLPRAPFDLANVARQTDLMGVRPPTEERYAPETALLRAGGIAVRPGVTPASEDPRSPTRLKQVKEFVNDQGQLEGQLNAIARMQFSGDPDEDRAIKAKLFAAVVAKMKKRAADLSAGTTAIQRAKAQK